jgi:protein-S-isoprenylcysteine O-methyltransferase Ste14
MSVYARLIGALWFFLAAYWAIAAVRAKRAVGRPSWRGHMGVRLGLAALLVLALRVPVVRDAFRHARVPLAVSGLAGAIGVACCALGIGLAVWARVHLGRNWGMPMSRKQDPQLVTSGPYAFVRHPIYTGIILAMLGSAIAVNPFWLIPLIAIAIYFVVSARREEAYLITQFHDEYRAYMKRTKMLLPFVF